MEQTALGAGLKGGGSRVVRGAVYRFSFGLLMGSACVAQGLKGKQKAETEIEVKMDLFNNTYRCIN